MNEYNYTYNNNNGAEENGNNYTGFSTDGGNNNQKPPKKHTGLKAAAFVLAMVVVSGGSINAYRYFADEKPSSSSVSDDDITADSSMETKESIIKAQAVSIIEPTETDGKALSTEEVVKKVLPSVVGIESSFEMAQSMPSIGDDFFDFGFGGFGGFDYGESEPQTREFKGTGTGVIVTENGYIVTNAHVIYDSEYQSGLAKEVNVLLDDDTSYEAEVIGYDVDCDLAVLKIDESGLTPAEFGDSDSLQLGESVIAIGNPLGFDLKNTVTGGMISGLDRNITINDKCMNLIQTDTAINSGNSGGPLINKYGQVIGINSSKMSSSYSTSGASIEGIGFAIPSNTAASIIDDIMQYGYVTGKPQLGISCKAIDEASAKMNDWPMGIYVYAVNKDSAAQKAGLRRGDIIVKADGKKVTTFEELVAEMNKHSAGEEFEITFVRDDDEQTVTVTLDEKVNENPAEEEETTEAETKKSKKNNDAEAEESEEEEEEETTTKSKKSGKIVLGEDDE